MAELPSLTVLDPALLARGMLDPKRRGPLQDWREGRIRPVLTRRMLAHALELLKGLGCSREALARWALWLTDADRVRLLPDGPPGRPLLEEYVDAARRSGAGVILAERPEDFQEVAHEGIRIILAQGWPKGYFDAVVGKWKGEPLVRPPQGDYEPRDGL